MRLRVLAVPVATIACLVVGHASAPRADSAPAPAQDLRISVVSTRADLVSGGDALVQVALPNGVDAADVRVYAGDEEVTSQFALRRDGRYQGLLTGLAVGRTTLRATAPGHVGRVRVTNHPNGGPVFSGPQSRHYECQPTAVDKKCNELATYTLLYKSTNPLKSGLQPYDPEDPAADVATATTDRGVTVPFIVRREDGFQARDRYSIMTLFQPGKKWRPWAPQKQWNHKVYVPHGGSCGATQAPGEPPISDFSGTIPEIPGYTQSYEVALGRGYAVMSTALDNTGHNCHLVTGAESLVMAKERIVERYGRIRFTIGSGCSGGSIATQTIANAYPGIYQGLVTSCSYPDAISTAAQFADYHLLRAYFENPLGWSLDALWLPTQFGAVEGHLSHLNAVTSDELFFKAAINPREACPGAKPTEPDSPATIYDAETNPRGVRCTVPEMMVNALGRRAPELWSGAEKAAGHGFAALPVGNEGILYGLHALKRGLITKAQFVDLNLKVGGLDVDGNHIPERLPGDKRAIGNAFRTGLINEGQNLGTVAMINHGGPDPGIAHDYSHAYWMHSRLRRSQGHVKNRVMWFGLFPIIGDPRWVTEGLRFMDRWLTAVERDHRSVPLARKIVDDRPDNLTNRCSNIPGIEKIPGPDGPLCEMPELQTRLGTPRTVSGGGVANDINQCRLKPLAKKDFLPIAFSDAQWAKLKATFPNGVCDYSRPGVGASERNQTWLTYADASGRVIYGGANLPPRAPGSMAGWTSGSFRPQLGR